MRGLVAIIVVGVATCMAVASADDHQVVHLWPGTPPDEHGQFGPEAVVAESGWTPPRYDIVNITDPRFDVWIPTTGTVSKKAAVLVIPGGGYSVVSITGEGEEIAEWLNKDGLIAFVLKYRVPSRQKVANYWCAVEDAQRAAGIIRSRAAEWGLNKDFKLGAIGFSAGGHMVGVLGANPQKRLYTPIDEYDEMKCGQDFSLLIYPAFIAGTGGGTIENPQKTVVPAKGIAMGPAFTVQAEDDFCTPDNAMAYANLVRLRGNKAECHIYPEGGHGYGIRPSKYEVTTWSQRADVWLRYIKVVD